MRDLFQQRERGEELHHVLTLDSQLIEKIRARARLADIAEVLAAKLRVDDGELLLRVVALGLDAQTGPALLLAPLVQVAWADGSVGNAERRVVLDAAASRGVEEGSPAHTTLLSWMKNRPSAELFETATECMRIGLDVLPAAERDERVAAIVAACRSVAEASNNPIGRLLGLNGLSADEGRVLDSIARKLRAKPATSH